LDKYDRKELENSKRRYKTATPKYDCSLYVKWIASIFIMVSMSMRGIPEYQLYDLILSTVGVTGWLVVGLLWKDRALVLLNGVGVALLLRNLFEVL